MDNNLKEKQEVKFEEVPVSPKGEAGKTRTDSYFDGGMLALLGWRLLAILITFITLGLGAPWAACMLYSYQFKHTVYNGKRLKFEGKGSDLFANVFKWVFLSIITLGIYAWFVPVDRAKWVISKLHYEDENYVKGDSYFDGNTLQLIGLNILSFILNVFSFGLLYPFTVCMRHRWINKHAVINRKKLVFTGSGLALWWKYIVWSFLLIITFGIYGLWLPIAELKWQTKNIHIKTVDEKSKSFDMTMLIIIPVIVLGIFMFSMAISRISEIDWEKEVNELPFMNAVCTVHKFLNRPDDVEFMEDAMYRRLTEKYDDGNITKEEMKKQIEKYNLEDAEKRYENKEGTRIEELPIKRDDKIVKENSKQTNTEKKNMTEQKEPAAETVETAKQKYVIVGGHKISYGTYTGKDALFDWEKQQEIPVNIKIVISENSILLDGQNRSYSISGDMIKVDGMPILQAMGDNTLVYLAQSCPTLKYEGEMK